MSTASVTNRRQLDFALWPKGVDSFNSPLYLDPQNVRWAINSVNKGGIWQTRPGLRDLYDFDVAVPGVVQDWWIAAGLPPIVCQGFRIFTPNSQVPYAIFAISGSVWAAKLKYDGKLDGFPFQLNGVRFLSNANQIVFCEAVQTSTIDNSGLVIPCPARKILIMQDGTNRACWFDGVNSGQFNPQKKIVTIAGPIDTYPTEWNQTRTGLWMAWSGNRLFVSQGTQVFASDLGDPTHFTEEFDLNAVPFINFPDTVTGLIDRGTSGNNNSQCLAFTKNTTWTMWSGVQQRASDGAATGGYPGWAGTNNWLTQIFAGTGCVAGKSIVNHQGLMFWLSEGGIVRFDDVNSVNSSQELPPVDYQMARAKIVTGPSKVLACAGRHDSYVYWSVPTGPSKGGRPQNGQTMVLDRQTVIQGPESSGLASWQGIWTGVNPCEWGQGDVFGTFRSYTLSMDGDGVPRIWQAFQGNRADNGLQIPWSVETGLHRMSDTLFDFGVFRSFRLLLSNVLGNLSVKGAWKSTRGKYHALLATNVTASPGTILLPVPQYYPMGNNTGSGTLVPQWRDITSPQFGGSNDCDSGEVEARQADGWADSKDRAFGLRFDFVGRGAILAYKMSVDDVIVPSQGQVSSDETGFNLLPGGDDCPQHIDGDTPAYVLADDNPLNAIFSDSIGLMGGIDVGQSGQAYTAPTAAHAAQPQPSPTPGPPVPPAPPAPEKVEVNFAFDRTAIPMVTPPQIYAVPENGYFQFTIFTNFTLNPGESQDVTVTFNGTVIYSRTETVDNSYFYSPTITKPPGTGSGTLVVATSGDSIYYDFNATTI